MATEITPIPQKQVKFKGHIMRKRDLKNLTVTPLRERQDREGDEPVAERAYVNNLRNAGGNPSKGRKPPKEHEGQNTVENHKRPKVRRCMDQKY